ncbi:MAG: hypothetical protein OXH77_09595 [Anaerolineaceae bacterium]|nr:hypothetical protein [Anaerolineaceae bacterium]
MIFTFRNALLLVILLALAGAAQADYHDVVFCGELAESDCALLKKATENSAGQTAGTYSLDMDLDLQGFGSGLQDTPGDYGISLDVDTVWSGDLSAFEAMGPESMSMMADPQAMLVMLGDLLSEVSGSATVTLVAPQGLPGVPEDEIPAALLNGVSMEMRLVDGHAYLDLSSLAMIMPVEDGVPSGWFGFHIMDLLETMLESGMMDMEMDGLPDEGADSASADSATMKQDLAAIETMIADWSDPEFLGTFMAVERLQDQIVEGRGVAVFHTSLDLSALFGSPEMRELMMASGELGQDAVGENDMDMMLGMAAVGENDMAMMDMMLGMVADAIDVEATQFIGLEDRLILRADTSMTMDLKAMMNPMGDSSEAMTQIAIDARMDYGYPAETPVINVPENAFIVSPGLLLAGADAQA